MPNAPNPTRLAASLLSAALVASCADKPNSLSCTVPFGVSKVAYPDGVPYALSLALSLHGEFVPPGAPFDATDVVETGNSRRVIFVWNKGSRWVVATEHGGIGYNNPVFAFDLTADRQRATLIEERIVFPETVCSDAANSLAVESTP